MARNKLAKVKEITNRTKQMVLERQGGLSITGRNLDGGVNYHHIVSKGCEGVGYEFNVVALHPIEHFNYHQGCKIQGEFRDWSPMEFDLFIDDYMKEHYSGWDRDICSYHPGWDEKDYFDAMKGKDGRK